MEQKKQRMQELVELLNRASRVYYQEASEIMSNFEYDKLYDELLALEEELGYTMANSPTVNVGYEVLSEGISLLETGWTHHRFDIPKWSS